MNVEQFWSTPEAENHVFYSAVIAASITGVVSGLVLHERGDMDTIAALYRTEGTAFGWSMHFVHVFLVAIFFIGVLTLLGAASRSIRVRLERPLVAPILITLTGTLYAMAIWVVVVAIAMPLWLRFTSENALPLPYLHEQSLYAAVFFGALLGFVFAFSFVLFSRGD